ncbi:MAG: hypothetical protein ACKVUS_07430 [Saprospiraceae bacterium]
MLKNSTFVFAAANYICVVEGTGKDFFKNSPQNVLHKNILFIFVPQIFEKQVLKSIQNIESQSLARTAGDQISQSTHQQIHPQYGRR